MAESVPGSPNIVLILCDDLGWRDLGCYGSPFYETPHIDRLAANGMRFTEAYASCPVCSPTRASVLTGKYPATLGLTQYLGAHNSGLLCDVPYIDRLPGEEITLPAALQQEAGYQTWHVGKWHLGPEEAWPEKRGFERNIGGCNWGRPMKGYFSPWECPTLADGHPGEYLTDRLNGEAVGLIENRDPARPFFLNYWPYAVHTPIQAPEPLVEKYRAKARALGLDRENPLEQGEEFSTLHLRGKHVVRRKFQSDPAYAAMIENLDTNIGKLVAALERAGIADNTLILFTSDNGGLATAEGSPTCNAPLAEGKGWMYEGGTREPFIASWPGVIPRGAVSHAVTTTPDVYPTLLEAAGIAPIPGRHTDGVSILPALRGETFERGPVFWHYPHYANQGGRPGCSVRHGDWKLIEFFEDNHLELYNLREDISENRDLAAREPVHRDALHRLLKEWRERVHARIPRPNPDWRP